MKKNLSTRIKRSLSRIKALYIFITDVYLSLDSEFIVNYIESKNIVIMSDNRTIELHDNATYIENYGDGPNPHCSHPLCNSLISNIRIF